MIGTRRAPVRTGADIVFSLSLSGTTSVGGGCRRLDRRRVLAFLRGPTRELRRPGRIGERDEGTAGIPLWLGLASLPRFGDRWRFCTLVLGPGIAPLPERDPKGWGGLGFGSSTSTRLARVEPVLDLRNEGSSLLGLLGPRLGG